MCWWGDEESEEWSIWRREVQWNDLWSLQVLRQYFDINNSPTEEAIREMSIKAGLPEKVIKHWFRNTLFKVRLRPLLATPPSNDVIKGATKRQRLTVQFLHSSKCGNRSGHLWEDWRGKSRPFDSWGEIERKINDQNGRKEREWWHLRMR